MTRDAFLARLREGLRGLAPSAVDDIVADYAAHFAEGAAAGRSDAQIAQALGDPARLARELRAEQGMKRWEEERNPTAAVGAVFAVLGLGAIDLLILLPLLIAVGSVMFVLFCVSIGVFFGGGWMFVSGLFGTFPQGGPNMIQVVMMGLGMMAGGVCLGSLLSLAVIGLVNVLVRYGRLHYQLLQPATAA